MFRCFILLILLLPAFGVSSLAREDVAAGWSRVETDNFEFIGNASDASIRSVAERLERFRNALGRVLEIPRSSTKTQVIVFKDAATFSIFKPRRAGGGRDEKVAGLFIPGDDLDHIVLSADSDLSTVYHEYVHDVIDAQFGRSQVPPWLNEGLAEYFETIGSGPEGLVTFGHAGPERLKILRGGPLVSFSDLTAVDNFTLHQGDDASREIFYAQSWAVTAYLIGRSRDLAGENGRLNRTIRPATLHKIATESDAGSIEKGMRAVIAGSASTVYTIQTTGSLSSFGSHTAPISIAVAYATLGDLYFRLRNDLAEEYLRKAIEIDPRNAPAHATLGLVRVRERKFSEGRAFIEKAVEMDSSNHLVHFYRAFLLLQESMDEAGFIGNIEPGKVAKIRESVGRSIKLNPEFAESHKLFALVELAVGGDLASAEKAAMTASALQPGNQNYSLLLAQVLLRRERFGDAVLIAERLAAHPQNPRIKAESRAVLKTVEEFENAKKNESADAEPGKLHIAGFRKPLILQYRDLTPEKVAKIEADRENYNYNLLVERPAEGESYSLGSIDEIVCGDDRIVFRIKTAAGPLALRARKFDDLRFRVALPGSRSFAFRCGSRMPDDHALIVFTPDAQNVSKGEIKAISFVPKEFEYRTREELIASPFVVIEGRPGQDISGNAKEAAEARREMERVMRETQIRDISERLRSPQTGETRVIGIPESLVCQNGRMQVSVKIAGETKQFTTSIAKPFEVQSYNSKAPIVEVGCRAHLPQLPAVITFRGSELLAVEFVPGYFELL